MGFFLEGIGGSATHNLILLSQNVKEMYVLLGKRVEQQLQF